LVGVCSAVDGGINDYRLLMLRRPYGVAVLDEHVEAAIGDEDDALVK
jgi:hypothetical protein